MTKEDAIKMINDLYAQIMQGKQGSGKHHNSYVYWRIPRKWKGTKYRIGYTPWKIQCRDKIGFFAVKYRETKNKLKLVKIMRFASRKKAKARGLEWFRKYYESAQKAV